MASGQSVFKGAFGWDDWVWWVAIGCVALLILLLLVCCCVCMQRAKRKGHEEALANVQAHQRLTQERERAEQQHQQQLRYQQARDLTLNSNGSANGYQPPGFNQYPPQVTAVPLAPNRKNVGPQVAANGYREDAHSQQFAKAYPPLPQQAAGQTPAQQNYQAPPKWFNAGQSRSPLSHGYEANAPRLSSGSFGFEHQTSTQYPDSMRYDDPYPTGGGVEGVPFVSVTSPSASNSMKQNRKRGVKLHNQAGNSVQEPLPAPVVVPRYTRPPSSPSEARASVGSGETLQSRIDALRSANSNDMVHSRISMGPGDFADSTARSGGTHSTTQMPRALTAQDSYASGSARPSRVLMGSVLSPNSSAMSSPFSSPPTSLETGRSYETFDPEAFESAKSTELGGQLTHGSSRSIGSDYSHGQFEDADSFFTAKRQNSGNGASTTPSRPNRGDNVSYNSRDSVEF